MSAQSVSRRSFLTLSALSALTAALDWNKINAWAARMGPKTDYPTVVIGAGLGGLCCGAYLAGQGLPVTVVEQHNIPGGYATAFERAEGKFRFEVSLHGTSINNNATARILNNLGVLEKLELVPLPEVYRFKAPGLDISVPQQDPEAYSRLLSRHFPKETDGIRSFVQEMVALSEEVDRLHQKKGKFLKILFPIQYRRMWNIRNRTLAELLNNHVRDPGLQNVLSALWGYYGLPPSKLSAFYYANATGEYLRNGSFYIKERSQQLSDALAGAIEKQGGKILYETRADQIRIKNGAAAGVALSNGQTLPARAVVSNASALTTFEKLVPREAVPPVYLRKLQAFRPSISSFIVWLGLARELRGRISGSGIYVSSGRGTEADYRSALAGEVDQGSFSVSLYDNVFAGYSRPGTSTVMLLFLCGFEPWRRFEADYRAGRKGEYQKEKDRWTTILIRRAEREVIPGLASLIAVQEGATPLTNLRFTGNPEGAIYGFEQSLDNAFMNRLENRTPVQGLYLAGAWGSPGGGFAGALRGGELAFEQIMADWA
ncbi:MAG: NAD(P)/FAD-dependent oxidoreductase [Deltaproteobacteria bacterium]|nr:NAD(P)/FAD-dependent oxidoreductase [Deltaproteobacteria bacterium]